MRSIILIGTSIVVVALLFFYSRPTKTIEKRLVNVYGFANRLNPDEINGNECLVKVIQIRGDSLLIDSCYATVDEFKVEFEKNRDNTHLNFNKKVLKNSRSLVRNKQSIFSKLNLITTKKLRTMEKEIDNYSCDQPFGVELELIEGNTTEVIQLKDIRTCKGTYVEFVKDLMEEFNRQIN